MCAACFSALACGGSGDASSHPTAPTVQGLQLSIVFSVNNVKFGTAVPGDFLVTVSGPATPVSLAPGDGDSTVMVNAGLTYAVTVTGPAGYDVNRSPECSGISAAGQKVCKIALQEAPFTCDDVLWSDVYLRDRLKVLSNCQAASGMVADVGLERDGDLVMELIPDGPYASLMRPGNAADPDAHKHLIVEVPCQGATGDSAPKAACAQFTGPKITPPPIGSHIVAAAHWVEDRNHSSWGELHGARVLLLPR